MPLVQDLGDMVEERLELGAPDPFPRGVDERRVAGDLAQAQQGLEHLDRGARDPLGLDLLRAGSPGSGLAC